MLNRSLETHPGFVLIGFVCVDMGSALCLLFLITKMKVAVDADFALAYALSKSIRAPRLALDAASPRARAAIPRARGRARRAHPGRGRPAGRRR